MPVVNVDDTAPTWVSGTSFLALAGTPFLYDAEADDDGDTTVEPLQYSLKSGLQDDADLLNIDVESGVVTLKDGVLVPEGKNAFTFTVQAFDGVNDPIAQTVVASLSSLTQVQGAGVLQQGGIRVVDIDNGDGTYTLEFYLDDSVVGNFPAVGSFDFVIDFDSTQFDPIAGSDFTHNALFTVLVNNTVEGELSLGAFLKDPFGAYFDPSSGEPLTSVLVKPTVEADVGITIRGVIVEDDNATLSDLNDTVIVYGEPAIITGTAGNESFVLSGGESEITGGLGIDAYIVTETTGNGTIITDFMPGDDVIDMTSLLLGAGYTSLSDMDLGPATSGEVREYSQTSMDLLAELQSDSPLLDNTFGMVINDTSGIITVFYDADSDAESVDLVTFEINIGEAVADITLDDLAAGIGGFIA
jgi:hypothetical protein